MRAFRLAVPLFAALLLAPAQLAAQEGSLMGPYPGVEYRSGPIHFCAGYVAIDVAADERVGWQRGPDFDLYYLQSSRGGFGLYQGNHPDRGGTAEPATVSGLPAERLREAERGYSYLVQVPGPSIPTFVHLFGAAWQGDERDEALLARVRIGQPVSLGCERPTFAR
jgi:hypothetical protein